MTETELEELNVLRTKALLVEAVAYKCSDGQYAFAWAPHGEHHRLADENMFYETTEIDCLRKGLELICAGAKQQLKNKY